MGVFTKLSESDFSEILTNYEIGEYVAHQEISAGIQNSNFFLTTSGGKFVLTVYEDYVSEDELPFFLGLLSHINKAGINVPQPQDAQGEVSIKYNDKNLAIFSLLQGDELKRVGAKDCTKVGNILADIHNATERFNLKRANNFHFDEFDKHIAELGEYEFIDEIESINAELKEFYDSIGDDIPEGIIHADLFKDNIFFDKSGVVTGVLDFYFACNDYLIYDLAITLNAWAFDEGKSYNMTKGRALIKAYNEGRQISDLEKEYFSKFSALAALRIILLRLYEGKNEGKAVKNPQEYLDRLRFHMQVKSFGEYGV